MELAKQRTEDKSEYDDRLIASERAAAEKWLVAYQAFEDGLIREGKDPTDESLFKPFYDKHGTPRDSLAMTTMDVYRELKRSPIVIVGGATAFAIAVIVLRRRLTRKKASLTSAG